MAKNARVHEGGKVGRSNATPTQLFKLAVRTRLHAGQAELLRTEIHAVVVVGHLSFFRIFFSTL